MGNDGRMAMNFREAAPCSLSPLWDDCLTHPVTLDRHEWGAYDDLFTNEFSYYGVQLYSSAHPTSTSGGLTVAMLDRLRTHCRVPSNGWVYVADYPATPVKTRRLV